MKDIGKTTSSISIAVLLFCSLLTAMFLSSLLITPAAAPDVLSTPIGKTINVTSGETFVLPFLMRFNETDDGFFAVTFYWDVNETDPSGQYWNFTYESNIARFVDTTAFSGTINVSIDKEVPYGYPSGYYRYSVQVFEAYGEAYGTAVSPQNFWVNVTMRAAGQGASYINHTGGDQNITVVKARCYETETVEVGPGEVTIHVIGLDLVAATDVRTFSTKHGLAGSPYTPVTECYMTWSIGINVTVQNLGTGTETFTVWAIARNATGNYTIGSASVTLAGGASTNKTFTWDVPDLAKVVCTPYWTYTIYGNATHPGDSKLDNNVKAGPTVKVKYYGDGNGDGKVGLPDLMILSMAYKPGTVGAPNYNPQADFSGDGPIGLPDLMILSMNYKKGPCE